jgi:hypothetical protein
VKTLPLSLRHTEARSPSLKLVPGQYEVKGCRRYYSRPTRRPQGNSLDKGGEQKRNFAVSLIVIEAVDLAPNAFALVAPVTGDSSFSVSIVLSQATLPRIRDGLKSKRCERRPIVRLHHVGCPGAIQTCQGKVQAAVRCSKSHPRGRTSRQSRQKDPLSTVNPCQYLCFGRSL